MTKFETGKSYRPYDCNFDPIIVDRRTDKTIFVHTELGVAWKMRIWVNENGDECVTDSTVPRKWRTAFTYNSRFPEEDA